MIDSSGYKCTEDGVISGVLSAAKDGLISAVLDARSLSRDAYGVHTRSSQTLPESGHNGLRQMASRKGRSQLPDSRND